jgi:glycosyltransferase involved in cell wall biosynthesis
VDYSAVRRSRSGRLIARTLGMPIAQAWLAFRQRGSHRAVLTDGEHISIPLALLLKAARDSLPHVTIGHRIATRQKRPFFRWLKAHSHISRIVLHSTVQRRLAVTELGIPAEMLTVLPFGVDTTFWCPQPVAEERMICSVGLEHRDYPTLFRAADGLDARVVVGAASVWSHQRNSAAGAAPPANVEVSAFDYFQLRDVYARAAVVVVPLFDVDFQAGITTILEAMAMGKPVIVTQTRGQVDVVEDGRTTTPGTPSRTRDESLLRTLAAANDQVIEPNGLYVPPGDPVALRQAITFLLDHPEERARLGASGRRAVEQLMSVDHWVARLSRLVEDAAASRAASGGAAPAATRSVVATESVG